MVFKRLFGIGSSTENNERQLEDVRDLAAGDLLTFKQRLALPEPIQGQTFEVSDVATYQYEDGVYMSLTLVGEQRNKVTLGFDPDDAHGEIDLGIVVPRNDVLTLFDEDAFARLWDATPGIELEVIAKPDAYEPWCANRYTQVISDGVGFYFDRDCRGETLSTRHDDDSEELRYHECEGDDDRFTLSVEIWGDGETEVSLEVSCPPDVVETMWPGT